MAERTPKGVLVAVVLWLVILGGMATAVRLLALPRYLSHRRQRLASQTGSEGKYQNHVRVAADGFSGYCLLRSPELATRLGREGIKLEVTDDGADYQGRIRDLRDGDVQLAVFPLNSFIQCGDRLGEFPGSIIYILDETMGADAIVAHKDAVAGIADLNSPDARIVLTPDSPSEFLARVMIASFSLPELPESKWMVEVDGSAEAYKRFRGDTRGKPVAYALWEPDVSRALREKDTHILLDTSKARGFVVDVLVARREFLIENYDAARTIVECYARTAYAQQGSMASAVEADAKATGQNLKRAEAEQTVKGIEWKNILENYAHFGLQGEAHALENIEDMLMKISAVLVKTGALARDPLREGANHLYFSKILQDIKDSNFHPGRELDLLGNLDPGGAGLALREQQKLTALTEVEWEQLATVGELRVEPIQFGRGTARVSIQSRHELAALAQTLNSWPHYYLTVIGRVRPGGDPEAAMQLARQRADATVSELTDRGVAPVRIRAQARIAAADTTAAQSVGFLVGEKR